MGLGKKKKKNEDLKAKEIKPDVEKEKSPEVSEPQELGSQIVIPELMILEELRGLRLDIRYLYDELIAMHKTLKEAVEDEE